MPNFSIYMREETFKLLEQLRADAHISRGAYLSELVLKDAAEKGIYTTRKAVRPGIR